MTSAQFFQPITVDGSEVVLRVFVPTRDERKRAAVVMVCGLGWLGGGILGIIGKTFNDRFGYAFANASVPCVQIHTPSRHLAHTRLLDLSAILLWPMTWVPLLNFPLLLLDVLFLAVTLWDFLAILFIPAVMFIGPLALPLLHGSLRASQWLQGVLPAPPPRNHLHDVEGAVQWAKKNPAKLGSNGNLVLCGYSSGAQCAAQFALAGAHNFESVVLISGIYNLHTDAWKGFSAALAPLVNLALSDILNASAEDRLTLSPEWNVQGRLEGQHWLVLNAQNELMGLPFQDLLFASEGLCEKLAANGARVTREVCGLNHWLLLFSFDAFARRHRYLKATTE
eukprot:TRINITY_DN38660_c0_g1_i1.p1 TRINITY_DN38660_c0_g1~~TRINITY_DN38660_c0_g1_i1.p1  ORF type:complete len:338 (+),score=41.82 TRINITY_DN38660_c0_g1_i1:64-1077(+)